MRGKTSVRKMLGLCGGILCFVTLVCPSNAQDSDAARLYRAQFIDLYTKAKQILQKADKLVRAAPTDRSIPDLRQEIHTMKDRVDQLREKAVQSNLDEIKNGELSSKTFLLVSAGCEEIDFVLRALDSFLDTRDPDFLEFAKRGQSITEALEQTIVTVDQEESHLRKGRQFGISR